MLDDPVYKNVSLDFALSKIQIPSGVENWRSVTIVKSGTYKIEITGANGGHTWTKSNFAVFGGNGGHVVAQKQFNAGDVIKVRVGREGAGVAKLDAINNSLVRDNTVNQQAVKPGGWPNGGSGGASYKTSIAGSGGGGATEVYYAGEYGSEKALDESKLAGSDIILVAGGGGGAASSTRLINNDGPAPGIRGGNAGPEPEPAICTGGGNAGRIADSPQAYTLAAPLSAPYSDIGTSGLRTLFLTVSGNTTYAYGEYAPDSYVIYGGNDGKGANGRNHDGYWEGTGGGGGGYAGGNAIKSASAGATGSGGGGSNYVANDFTTVTNETSATYGDGAFSIEWVVSN
ncbi:MAG: hypothetical protein LBC27_08195 [Spirochaetaceae bacterium]|nr:hypothetical protein [Spirochaetaceae bacterium]